MIFDVAALESLNYVLATLGLVAIALCAFILFDLWRGQTLKPVVQKWGLLFAFGVSAVSIVLTLVYSELFGITPCGFCWLERMALYPQVLLIGVSFYYKDSFMPRYGIALSAFGFVLSLYHHYIQMGGTEFIACPTSGAECAKRFMFEYGFVTFPLLSAVLFAILIAVYLYILRSNKA